MTQFFNQPEYFAKLDWDTIYSEKWHNTQQDPDRQRRKQAEYLVKKCVPVDCFAYLLVNREKKNKKWNLCSKHSRWTFPSKFLKRPTMIRFETGNLLAARVEAMVNTVNTVGVMGKGIALQFKMNFPDNFRAYVAACERGEVEIGKMFVTKTNRMDGLQYIINFPTKKHWKQPSKLEYIQAGLIDLKRILLENNIGSIALPPLGCGNGGLDWAVVKPLIQDALGNLPVSVIVFEPSEAVKKVLDA